MSMPVISALDFTGESMVDETIQKDSPMKRFYRNKTVFITGGMGFLGQLIIEKLLRCQAKVVYVLVRPKKNKSSIERIRETFVGDVFVKLRSSDPNYLARIKLIEGDTNKADIGIYPQDRTELIENVEILVHAAADVRFDKPLQELCFTNVRGTKAVTLLAEEMKNLIMFAYVSTAYSQFYQDKIEEKFYPPPCDPDDMIRISEYFDKHKTDELQSLTEKLIHPWENTYVFTKAVAEEVVRRASHKIPTVVIRPSIIISTYEEPIPGWANNVYGVNGMTVAAGYGFIKVIPSGPEIKANVICADIVVNGTLAAIWSKANQFNEKASTNLEDCDESTTTICHITAQNSLTNVQFAEEVRRLFYESPSIQCLWLPSLTFLNSQLAFFILTIIYHAIPAIALDTLFKLTNNPQRLLPMYRKSQEFIIRTTYFSNRTWKFGYKNIKAIIDSMCEEDQRYFNCNVFKFDWIEYSYTYCLGLKTYVAKEPPNKETEAKRRFSFLRIIYYPTVTFYYICLACIFYSFMHLIGVTSLLKIWCNKLVLLISFYGSFLSKIINS